MTKRHHRALELADHFRAHLVSVVLGICSTPEFMMGLRCAVTSEDLKKRLKLKVKDAIQQFHDSLEPVTAKLPTMWILVWWASLLKLEIYGGTIFTMVYENSGPLSGDCSVTVKFHQ